MFLYLILIAAVGTAGELCNQDRSGYCTDPVVTYELKTSEPTARIKVACNLGSVLAVQLPEGDKLRVDPAVGNAALFQYKLQEDTMTLLLWPQVPEGSKLTSRDLEGETSNIQIELASGINVILEMRIAYDPGVQRLVLDFPELEARLKKKKDLKAKIREEVEQEFKKKKEQLDEQSRDLALEIVARGIMERIHCTELSEREMTDLLVLRAHKICHLGSHVYLEVSIQNRARDLFTLKGLEILAVEGDDLNPLEAKSFWKSGHIPKLKFDRTARAVVCVPVTEETASSEYAVRVTESAGKKRIVTLEGIEF